MGVLFHSDYSAGGEGNSYRYKIRSPFCPRHRPPHCGDRDPLNSQSVLGVKRARHACTPDTADQSPPRERVRGSGAEVLLPLPFEAISTNAYVGSEGQFQAQPYFHDSSEVLGHSDVCLCDSIGDLQSCFAGQEVQSLRCTSLSPLRSTCDPPTGD